MKKSFSQRGERRWSRLEILELRHWPRLETCRGEAWQAGSQGRLARAWPAQLGSQGSWQLAGARLT